MKKDIFEVWLKEFCSLVFIQAVQAFIFAIVMSLIVSTMSGITGTSEDKSVVSIIAIIGLASVSKIEDLVKKIFGVSSSVTDPSMKGGMKSLATTMIAAKLAGNFLNNAKKMTTGVSDAVGSRKDVNKARNRYLRDIGNVNDSGRVANANTASATGGSSSDDAEERRQLADAGFSDSRINESRSAGVGASARLSSTSASSGTAGGTHTPSTTATNASANAARLEAKDRDKLNQIQDKYDDALSAAKKKRREGIMRMASSGLETAGGIGGAMLGASLGAALGEGGDVMKYTLGGLGVGDKLGSMPMAAAGSAYDISNDIASAAKTKKEFESYIDKSYADVKSTISGRISEYSKAKKTFDKIQKEINKSVNAGNME